MNSLKQSLASYVVGLGRTYDFHTPPQSDFLFITVALNIQMTIFMLQRLYSGFLGLEYRVLSLLHTLEY